MSKVFKIIMNVVLILFIAALCALFIPPFLGITTAVADLGSETNMQEGSVAYGVRESLSNLQNGDSIIVSNDDSTYIYEVESVDTSTGEITVLASEDSEPEVIELRRTASKLVVVVPLIGYILLATQSIEGLIILVLAAAFIIILFIIASILFKKPASNEDEDEDSDIDSDIDYFQTLAASASRPSSLDSLETRVIPPVDETAGDIVEESIPEETIALDEEIEDSPELILEPADEAGKVPSNETINITVPQEEDTAPLPGAKAPAKPVVEKDVRREVEKSASQNVQTQSGAQTGEFSDIENALENILGTEQINQTPEDVHDSQPVSAKADTTAPEEEEQTEIELAIPIYTLDELLEEAYANGEDPQVKKYPVTGATLVDYSSSL